ncbi:tRNA pseudouridine13 synthase [Fistulifera solaris]|uniref:tRNA pseudouridine13 synthase n=1 Tax=Fistulifera solaris TaxID=1519565 RepID=A0A1Z5KN81_FISSO|nr:tRNA pseudouridine13 synthase [Fistulifera solaris]|eukprot:GAX27746.1 tRNA pseudouridine13 synthase [Fistulifera solaris]
MTDHEVIYDPIEQSLGLTAYLSPHVPGFSAISKGRFSDFIVHEVDLDGSIARLESLEPTVIGDVVDSSVQTEAEESRKRKREEANDVHSEPVWSDLENELKALTDDTAAKAAILFLRKVQENTNDSEVGDERYVSLPPANDKDKRRDLHQWIRDRLGFCARADTISGSGNNDKVIRIWHVRFEKEMPNYKAFENGRNAMHRDSNNNQRPPKGMKFVKFVLYKENMETGMAISQLQRQGGKQGRLRIGFAGNKDKRGVTSQFVTAPAHTPLSVLCKCNGYNNKSQGGGNTKLSGTSVLRVGNFQFVEKDLRLGSLRGNRFEVALRNIVAKDGSTEKPPKDVLESAVDAIRNNGFINYFGMQRFGKYYDTHLIGIEIIKGSFEKAIDIIMSPKAGEKENIKKAREEWQNRFDNVPSDGRAAAEKQVADRLACQFQRGITTELAIVQSLARFPLDYKRAFSCIPKTLRLMFIHAFQSFLWNAAVSARLTQDANVQVGDLVLAEDEKADDNTHSTVKALSQADIDSSQFTILDLVFPLIGYKSVLPKNSSGELLERLMTDQGITRDMLKRIEDRDLTCPGDYRKILCKASDVTSRILSYNDPLQPLIQTDLMKVNNVDIEASDGEADRGLLGMTISFTLPSSSYATIFLRELMKRPTSSEYQSKLSLGTIANNDD